MAVFSWDPHAYGTALAPLLECDEPCPLGPGTPRLDLRPRLEACDVQTLAGPHQLVDRELARGCLAGLWLLHGFLDESHRISQQLASPSGSYWHGIMHRREGDFPNAKYWFRRVGTHPLFPHLAQAARPLVAAARPEKPWPFLEADRSWDPLTFTDLCAAASHAAGEDQRLCREVAQLEWQLLFDFCYRRAVGLD